MLSIVRVLVVLVYVHVEVLVAASVNKPSELVAEPAACDNVACQGTSENQQVLLQMARQTDRIDPQNPAALTETMPQRNVQLAFLDDVFLYDHLPKAGGSFVRGVLNNSKVIPVHNVRIVREAETLSEDDRRLTFTVGSVRNPCEYYVSCWAFGQKVGYGVPAAYNGTSPSLNTTQDQQRFRAWLRYIMPKNMTPPGLLTTRMLWSYANQSLGKSNRPGPTLNEWHAEDRLIYHAAEKSFRPSSVSCWIKTESLVLDLRMCLQRFEQHAGSSVVNWKEYNATAARYELEHQVGTVDSYKNVWTKNSGHQPCDFYFDKASKDFVFKADNAIFSKFGYPACCARRP